jgi:hypothetical protein
VNDRAQERAGLPLEVAVVGLLFAIVAAEILVTYSRLPASELYHVSGSGLEGGMGRTLVFLNFPTALVAFAVLGLIYRRLPDRVAKGIAVASAALCLPVFWPGVVSQANLDAKPVNASAAVGVLLTLALCVRLAWRGGSERRPWRRSDLARAAIAAVLVVASLPWFGAELGFFLNGVPVLRSIYQSRPYLPRVAGLPPFPPAVHHGHHHGMDGLLLVLSALLLSRALTRVRYLAAYLALMFCYGIANMANDFWTEQVFKRHWTTWQIPDVLEPRPTLAWGVIVVAAAATWWLARKRAGEEARTGSPSIRGVRSPIEPR